jgi:DNA-binding response OmpR family regulator
MAADKSPSSQGGTKGNRSLSVMVVDDDPLLVEHIALTLRDVGYEVTPVEDGEAALYMLPDLELDLIVLDLNMPGMNGMEVLRHLKAEKATAAIPVMMLTGSTDAENVKKALELGARDYIAKPFEASKLLTRIEKLMERLQKEKGSAGKMVWEAKQNGFDVPLQKAKARIILTPSGGKSGNN